MAPELIVVLTGFSTTVVVSVVSPLILGWATNRARHSEEMDRAATRRDELERAEARQDKVAARAEEAARRLLTRTDQVAAQAAQAADKIVAANMTTTDAVIETTSVTNAKLDQIHTLVNSNMTAAMQSELDATKRELAMMNEVIDLKKAAGRPPTQDVLSTLEITKAKISELEAQLADRLKQTKLAETQLAAAEARVKQLTPPETPE